MSRLIDRRFVIRTAVSVVLLGFLIWRVDLREAGQALRHADYIYVVPALTVFGAGKFLVGVRWRLMMSSFVRLPLSPLIAILFVSNMANNVLPARLGDLVRVQVPAQRYGISRARLAATVFATESLLDGVAMAGIGLIGLALIDLQGFPTGVFWGLFGLMVGGMIAVVPVSHLKLSEGWECRGVLGLLPHRLQHAIEEAVPHFIEGLAVFRNGRLAAQALALSFTIWLMEVAVFALFGKAFGVTLSMPAWMLIMVAANLISAVPVAPSNIGAYEVAIAELMQALGVAEGAAGGFAIASHVLNIAWITAAGFAAMWALGMGLDDVFSFRRKPNEAPEPVPRAAAEPG
jgi:uncharacterized protein (TIRG00374 family)